MNDIYLQFCKDYKDLVTLIDKVRKQYEIAKSLYKYEDRSTWDSYVFWRSKYEGLLDQYHQSSFNYLR